MFRFDNTYPISAPAVQFVVDETHKAPVHPVRLLPKLVLFVDSDTLGTTAHLLKWACKCELTPPARGVVNLSGIDLCVHIG
jgi:hypothetical protein